MVKKVLYCFDINNNRDFVLICCIHHIMEITNNMYSILWDKLQEGDDTPENLWVILWNGVPIFPKNCIIFNFDCMSITANYDQFVSQLDNSPDTQIRAFVDFSGTTNPAIMTSLISANSAKFPGENYQVVPYGCTMYNNFLWNSFVPNPLPEKDIDVLYYGSNAGRRADIINVVSEYCLSIGKVFYYLSTDPLDEKTKCEYVVRSRIVLSIVGDDDLTYQMNDLLKVSYLICNKIVCIAEFTGDPIETTLSSYTTYTNTIDNMNERINYFLLTATETEINDYVNNAYEHFHVDFPYQDTIGNLIAPFTV